MAFNNLLLLHSLVLGEKFIDSLHEVLPIFLLAATRPIDHITVLLEVGIHRRIRLKLVEVFFDLCNFGFEPFNFLLTNRYFLRLGLLLDLKALFQSFCDSLDEFRECSI